MILIRAVQTMMKSHLLLILLLISFEVITSDVVQSDDILNLIDEGGYKGEAHQVETEDGYLLKVHRLRTKGEKSLKPPVFLMHGLFSTAADFLMSGPKKALAYYLLDNDYDVWLGNARGNKHSMNHKTLSADSREFWMFSWHEIGYYDLPAMIDYMLNVTNASKAFYVGHSQGCTTFAVLLSTRPEYNDKIIQAHLMAPAIFMGNLPHPVLRILSKQMLDGLFREYTFLRFEALFEVLQKIIKKICNEKDSIEICEPILFSFYGPNRDKTEIEPNVIRIFLLHISPRQSVGQFLHFVQSFITGKFQMFDYGDKNIEVYNSTSPPDYELQNIIVPTFIYHGKQDLVVAKIDVEHLRDVLPNIKDYRVIPNWNHGDFCYGKNSRRVLYKDIVKAFETVK